MHADDIRIPEPCHEDWGAMHPEGKRRFCDVCTKHVHDLSAMTHAQASDLLRSGDDVCVRFAMRPDGEVVHRPEVAHRFARPGAGGLLGGVRRLAAVVVGATALAASPAMAGSAIAEVEEHEEKSWIRQALEAAVDWLEGEPEEVILMGDVAYEPPPPPVPPEIELLGEPVAPPRPPVLKGKPRRVPPPVPAVPPPAREPTSIPELEEK